MEEQQTSHGFLSKALSPANFDARGLLKPMSSIDPAAKRYLSWRLYSTYILSRDQTPGLDQAYVAFLPSINAQITSRGLPASQYNFFYQTSILNKIGKNVGVLIPRRAALAGLLRQYVLLLNPKQIYPLNDYDISNAPAFLKQLHIDVTINTAKRPEDTEKFLNLFYNATQGYEWYVVMFILALVSSFYILRFESVVFLAPITVYLANCALVLYSRTVAPRVFANIDVLLVLQIALGISLWLYRNSYAKARSKSIASI